MAQLGERCAGGGEAAARPSALAPARGLLSHLDSHSKAQPSSLVRVRTIKRSDRPPLLLPHQVQAILDGARSTTDRPANGRGNLRDRFLFALLAETGMRLGEALGMRINEFVMGRGGTPYVQVVPREDNPNGARVKMRGHAASTSAPTWNASTPTTSPISPAALPNSASRSARTSCCSATSIGHHCSPRFGKGRSGTRSPRSNSGASDPPAGPRTGFGTPTPPRCLSAGPRMGLSRRLGHAHVQTTLDLSAGSARTKRFAPRRIGRATPKAGRPPSMHPDPIPLHQPRRQTTVQPGSYPICQPNGTAT